MRMFFFDVAIKVHHEGGPREAMLLKGARAEDEMGARRAVLHDYLDAGFQVVRLGLAGEPGTRREFDP